jgi:3-isopropylmalate dehydrogenase
MFEPIHGSAPDIAGLDIANPAGAIASAAMLLRQIGQPDLARILDRAVEEALIEGNRTADLGGSARCSEFGGRVRDHLKRALVRHDAHLELVAMNRGCCG